MKTAMTKRLLAAATVLSLVLTGGVCAYAEGGNSIEGSVVSDHSTCTTFDGYQVTVLDQTDPAATMRGRATDRNVMCFVSASDQEVGVISYSDYNAIIAQNKKVIQLEGGGTLGVPPDGRSSWNEWLADEFNKFRELDAGSQEESVEIYQAEMIQEYCQELIRLVNLEREKAGLSAYVADDECMTYSQTRADELGKKYSHTRPDGSDAGYEIICVGPVTPEGAVFGWMNSPSHKAAILNENRVYVGAGVHINFNGTMYWQMYFERDPEVYANTLIFG